MTTYPPGAVRWPDPIANDHHVVDPGNEAYADALSCATEYWDGAEWKSIPQPEKKNA